MDLKSYMKRNHIQQKYWFRSFTAELTQKNFGHKLFLIYETTPYVWALAARPFAIESSTLEHLASTAWGIMG